MTLQISSWWIDFNPRIESSNELGWLRYMPRRPEGSLARIAYPIRQPVPPSTGSATPVTKRASSEAR